SDSPTRSLARRFAGVLRARGSLAVLARNRFPAIAAAGLAGALREDLGRLGDARAEDAERAEQRLRARQLNLRGRAANLGVAVGVGPDRLPVAEQAPPRAVQHRLHHPPGVEGIPEAVVVDDARDVGPRRQHRLERPLDRLPPRAPEDLL